MQGQELPPGRLRRQAEFRRDPVASLGLQQHVPVSLEVGRAIEPVDPAEERGVLISENLRDFGLGPDVRAPLLAFRLGVKCGVEFAVGARQRPRDEGKRRRGLGTPPRVARALEGEQVDRGDLGIVVEHLLEMRDRPVALRAIAMIAAGQVVADSAAGHPVERLEDL